LTDRIPLQPKYLKQVSISQLLSTPTQSTVWKASLSGQSGYVRREMHRIWQAQTTISNYAKNDLHAGHQDKDDGLVNKRSK
jgi:hypothetical protein